MGHVVRGSTRDPRRLAGIEATGAEAVRADPDRLGTLLPALEEVSAACWMAPVAPERLESLVDHLVDTPVRGLVVDGARVEAGAAVAAGGRRSVPVQPARGDAEAWLAAVRTVLGAR